MVRSQTNWPVSRITSPESRATCSKRRRCVYEDGRQAQLFLQMLAKGLRAEPFGTVVSPIKNIQAEFLNEVVCPVLRLSGDKEVDALVVEFTDELRV